MRLVSGLNYLKMRARSQIAQLILLDFSSSSFLELIPIRHQVNLTSQDLSLVQSLYVSANRARADGKIGKYN